MSEPNDDLPRYTWATDTLGIKIVRRVGIYGQEAVVILTTAGLDQGMAVTQEQKEIANAVCEYLDRRDREREEAGR